MTRPRTDVQQMTTSSPTRRDALWITENDCDIDDFKALVQQPTDLSEYPLAESVEGDVLVYGEELRSAAVGERGRREAQSELIRALMMGPGIVVFKRAFDASVVDRTTDAFNELIAQQKASGLAAGDHFAKPGANDRGL